MVLYVNTLQGNGWEYLLKQQSLSYNKSDISVSNFNMKKMKQVFNILKGLKKRRL